MTEPTTRPWWRKKRWAAALLLWLALPPLYVAAVGVLWYCDGRGWTPNELSWAAHRPGERVAEAVGLKGQWVRYTIRCAVLGMKHAASL